jgi:NMD protein affecting ribosome stability and mRNA decay
MSKEKHIHKLKKHKYPNGTAIFFCYLPDCHFKVEAALALGKQVLCTQCDEPFIMNEYTVRLTRPHCSNCGKRQIKNERGEKFYINKRAPNILREIAADDVNNLRNRLDSLVKDDDI